MALSRSRRDSGMNYWPGFVDALSTLILSIIFLLTVFMVAQFFLSQEVAGKDTALARLNAQISRLSDLLSLERTGKTSLEEEIAQLHASLSATEGERDRLRGAAAESQNAGAGRPRPGQCAQHAARSAEGGHRARHRADRKPQSADQRAAPADRRARGRARRLGEERKRRPAAHRRSRPAPQRRAGAAGAGTVALPLGFLRQAARNSRQPPRHPRRRRPLRVPIGSVLRQRRRGAAAGRPRRARQARRRARSTWKSKFPSEINWVLRVDGHTDTRQLSATSPFKSNWELSAARAISVVQYLISKGISPQRLVAAGFGEFQPIDPGTTEEAFSRNRRIELKLTERVRSVSFVCVFSRTTRRAMRPPRSRCGCGPGRRPIRSSISPRGSTGGASAGATSWCPRPRSSIAEAAGE